MNQAGTTRDTLVVIPCYNESQRLDLAQVETFVPAHPQVRFLFVDDGSTDTTSEILEALAGRYPDAVMWKKLAVNSGKAEAVRQGFLVGVQQAPKFLGYWDADFATPLDSIEEFRTKLVADAELLGVLGSRIRRLGAEVDRRALRHYTGRVFASLASLVLGIAVYDTQCGAKLFRLESALERAFAEPFRSRWVFDVEILARLQRELAADVLTKRLYEHPLSQWKDVGDSKVTLTQGALAFLELWEIYRKSR